MTAADPSGSRIASSGGSPDASPPPTRGQSLSTSKTGSRPTSKQAPQWQNLSSSDIDFSPRPEQTTEYWMKKPPSDFRRTKRMGHLARMASQAGLTTSKSLPTLQGSPGRGGGNSTQVNEANTVAQAEHRREEAELEALQKIADRRQREASLLEARRVKLEETLIEVRSEWARVCEDAYGKDFDAASAGETMAALQLEIDNLNAVSTVRRRGGARAADWSRARRRRRAHAERERAAPRGGKRGPARSGDRTRPCARRSFPTTSQRCSSSSGAATG